jgi:hypothetical protein
MTPDQTPANETETQNPARPVAKLKVHFIKSNLFRTIHMDGAWAGLAPNFNINIAIYSERQPIPLQIVQPVAENGALGEDFREERVSRDGLVREVEANLILDLATAKSFIELLVKMTAAIEQRLPQQMTAETPDSNAKPATADNNDGKTA